ncbi:MAG: mannitol dehydrogenase [Oscillospiraceae bacterium]|nr:mannitol dehydrogenase [Oscillospiraceae bacterium]
MKAVLFGAGSIGRGFIAELLTDAGIEVVFVDINNHLVEAINKQGCYKQIIVGINTKEKIISNVRAIDGSDTQNVISELCECALISISVGASVLCNIAPVIAQGLIKRWESEIYTPVNILICENLHKAESFLKSEILRHLPENYHKKLDELVGLLETSIGRMIPVVPEEAIKSNQATVYVEPYRYLPYDSAHVKGIMPYIPAAIPYSPFEYYTERKLFVHNMGHFICALYGHLLGYTYIWESIGNPTIAYFVRSAMSCSALALSKKHIVDYTELMEHVEDLLYRFSNKELRDTIERVLRDASRKLSPDERLYGALKLCEEQNVSTIYIQLGIAAANHLFPDRKAEDELVSTLLEVLKNGFDFVEIQNAIQQYQYSNTEMVI